MERWKVNLYILWFSQILSLMSFNFGIPFIPFYIQQLGVVDPEKIKIYAGVLNAAPAVTLAIMAPFWGIAADRWGKKLMLLRAMAFASVLIAAMGMVSNVGQLTVLRFVQGVFTGTVTAAAALVASGTPSNRISYSLGFLSSATFIGISAGPVIGGFLAERIGYRASFYIGGALMLVDFFLVLLLVKEEKVQFTVQKDDKKPLSSMRSVFTPAIIILILDIFILRFARSVFSPYLPLFVQESRSSLQGSAELTGIINGVSGIATALAGLTLSRLGDRCSKVKLMRILFILSIASSIPMAFFRNLWLFTAVYGVFFFLVGGIEPIAISMNAENTPPEKRGTLFGFQEMIGSLGWVVSPMVGGMVSIWFDIRSVLLAVPLSLLPGFIIILLLKNRAKDCGN